ncbi:MAG TPA: ATP-binding protein [bacterium]|nr:ATP-binding protein [bacterium]
MRTDSRPDSLRVARKQVREAALRAGASVGIASEIELAAGEALSNTYTHAYNGTAGPVEIQIDQTGTHVIVSVIDGGEATIAPVIPDTLPATTLIGGRGLYLMRRLLDDVTISISPTGHGLVVQMTRRVRRQGDELAVSERGDICGG